MAQNASRKTLENASTMLSCMKTKRPGRHRGVHMRRPKTEDHPEQTNRHISPLPLLHPLLIHPPSHRLPHFITANHNRTRRRNLQTPRRPPLEQPARPLFLENMIQEPRHRPLFRRKRLPRRRRQLVRMLKNLLPRLTHVKRRRDQGSHGA